MSSSTEHEEDEPGALEEELQTLARGRADRTPFVLFAGVNVLLLGLALVVGLVALVAWWLA